MKNSLKSIGAFAQQNETLNNETMGTVKGGKNGQYTLDDSVRKYSTSARTSGGDTDCKDLTPWGPTRIYF